jgi:hypothetical protein
MRIKAYGCIAIALLAGCTATQVRWDATNIRKEVMLYYNDQIMDNLIRAKNHLPFVHVDITLLTSTGGSQISGTIGAGETRTHTDSAASSIMKAVTRPFTYSVTPQQTETLTISAAPALGSQALASPTPGPTPKESPAPTPEPTPTWEDTKKTIETETTSADGKKTWKKEESTFKPAPTPKPITIYKLYEDFAKAYLRHTDSLIRPNPEQYVPGTLKRWDQKYYYIPADKDKQNQLAYYNFCKALFTKGQAGSLEKELEIIKAATAIQ